MALAFYAFSLREDPGKQHSLAAREMMTDHEMGRQPESIDYDHPVYQNALDELGKVPAESSYADRAARLAAEIRAKIVAYHRRREAFRVELEKNRNRTLARRRTFLENQRRQRLEPEPSYQECENGGTPASE